MNYAKKLENPTNEQILRNTQLSKTKSWKMEYFNKSVMGEEVERVIKNFPTKKSQETNGFIGEL